MKRAAAYARVSSSKQSETSIETQFEFIEHFAKEANIAIVEKFYDKITASGTKERPQFNKMIENALASKYDAIIVYKYDRFIRDNIEDQSLIRKLEQRGIYVLSANERIDTSTPSGRFQRWVISGMNRFYIENLQQEINQKSTKVAEKAYFMGGIPPYGFKVVEIRDKEAAVVRKIFKMYDEGYSYKEIAQTLNRAGFRTRKGNSWGVTTIYDMLRNEKYSGTFVWRKGTHSNGRRKREDTVVVPNALPRIIDQELFDRIQKRFQKSLENRTAYYSKPLLRGIFYCGECGARMIPTGVKDNRYVCSAWKRGKHPVCVAISVDKADNFVLSYLKNNVLSEDIDYELLAKGYNTERALQDLEFKKKMEELSFKKAKIEQKIDNAVQAILNGSPFADRLEKEADKLKEELSDIQKSLEKLKSSGPSYVAAEELKEKFDEYRKKLHSDRETQRSLILEMIEKVTIYKGGYIEIKSKM